MIDLSKERRGEFILLLPVLLEALGILLLPGSFGITFMGDNVLG